MADSDFPQPISSTKAWHSEPYPSSLTVPSCGATGIENAIAITFAKADAKSVSILRRQAGKLRLGAAKISNTVPLGGNTQVLHETADILDPVQLAAAVRSIAGKVGKIDVFIANAGSVAQLGPLVDQNVDHGYAVGKAASLKMLDYLAAENPHVYVVNVQPGWVASSLNGYQNEAPDSADLPGQFYVWLASPEAMFLQGKFVWANWDAQELLQRADEIPNSKPLTGSWTVFPCEIHC
ncbi:hypothetical protein BO78DRAFT_466673 [Aspergillus sclerotiicarbonarius CBS 121057]|uniref:NAD(P)-binding protein n=1 Tax=Aspergillus sclerotiicarbonarius (strain CBS 121057 / IBT 28362) TaxID=1448318 RepID=A0A319EL37_ASPSB|nr:hypothetical protein BO78DRAFT_466673 [Aspergillus sclerotiicarbonarius CBS 121057]